MHETAATEGYLASIPAEIRRELGIGPGDKLTGRTEDGNLRVTVRKRRERAFDELDQVSSIQRRVAVRP